MNVCDENQTVKVLKYSMRCCETVVVSVYYICQVCLFLSLEKVSVSKNHIVRVLVRTLDLQEDCKRDEAVLLSEEEEDHHHGCCAALQSSLWKGGVWVVVAEAVVVVVLYDSNEESYAAKRKRQWNETTIFRK